MFSKFAVAVVLAASLLAVGFADETAPEAEEEPQFGQVVFFKGLELDGEYMVVTKNFTAKYSLYNVGTKAVQNVHFTDQWPEEYFELVSGIAENTWAEIQPGQNVSTSVVLIPKTAGKFTTAPAQFSYESDSERKEGFSSSFGEVYVLTPEEHERVSATYVKEWVIFAVLSLLPLAAPFGVWNQHKKARLASLNKAK